MGKEIITEHNHTMNEQQRRRRGQQQLHGRPQEWVTTAENIIPIGSADTAVRDDDVADVRDRLRSNEVGRLALDEDGYRSVRLRFVYPRLRSVEVDAALTPSLRNNAHLESLNLYESFRGNDGDDAASTLGFLRTILYEIPRLRVLNLGGNGLGDDHASMIGDALDASNDNDSPSGLESLHLAGNAIRSTGARALANGLRHNRTLVELRLSGNRIGTEGCRSLALALTPPSPSRPTDDKEWSHTSSTTTDPKPHLRVLCLANCGVGDRGAHAIADMLRRNESLRQLFLGGNRIGDAGCAALADALRCNSSLLALCLGGNGRIKDAGVGGGASALVACLRDHNCTIEGLRVHGKLQEKINQLCGANREGKDRFVRRLVHVGGGDGLPGEVWPVALRRASALRQPGPLYETLRSNPQLFVAG